VGEVVPGRGELRPRAARGRGHLLELAWGGSTLLEERPRALEVGLGRSTPASAAATARATAASSRRMTTAPAWTHWPSWYGSSVTEAGIRAESAARLRACTAAGTATSPSRPSAPRRPSFTSFAGPATGSAAFRLLVTAAGGEAEAEDRQDQSPTQSHRQISPRGALQRRVRDGHLRGGPDLLERPRPAGRLRFQLVGQRGHARLAALLDHAESLASSSDPPTRRRGARGGHRPTINVRASRR